MATLLLTAVGTIVGGPLGGALGALAGRQIDTAILGGSGSRHGPRLRELAVSMSSYGQPIARHFGQMRAPGTIIWATDLKESKETSGGGKGKPKTTTYSYSASLAVAVSSRPIRSIGRIWADGNLLRGAAGDLKTAGSLRVHLGHGDQQADPLVASAMGGDCPAFRDCAYVVFEDLALADFGNRIPALSFEVFSEDAAPIRLSQIVPNVLAENTSDQLEHLLGFSDEGGDLASVLGAIGEVYPLCATVSALGLELARARPASGTVPTLSSELERGYEHEGRQTAGRERVRSAQAQPEPRALRYHDRDRDYQPGMQLAPGRHLPGRTRTVELPATLSSSDARELCLANAQTMASRSDQVTWRIAELDPSLGPGSIVKLPGHAGRWVISSWEWLDRGIELVLERLAALPNSPLAADSGTPSLPKDLLAGPSRLWAIELPPDGASGLNSGSYFLAVSGGEGNWNGASLYLERDATLVSLGISAHEQSVAGQLVEPLPPSGVALLQRDARLEVELASPDLGFTSAGLSALATGANRIFVGGEIIQFVTAEQTGANRWQLSGLLRGRGGTEHFAYTSHPAGTPVVGLDGALATIDSASVNIGGVTRIAAIGLGDDEPAYADLVENGISLNPPSPVHARIEIAPSGDRNLRWARRARGQWRWPDLVDAPLVEEAELYEVGAGPIEAPFASWRTATSSLSLPASTVDSLMATHGPMPLWVRQIGTYGASPATLVTQLS